MTHNQISLAQELPTWNEAFPHWHHKLRISDRVMSAVGTGPLNAQALEYARWVEDQPKIELHVHLEASVSDEFYAKLNQTQRLFEPHNLPCERLPFADLREFITAWFDHIRLIEHPQQISEMVEDFARARKRQNIVYSEVYISPLDFSSVRSRIFGNGLDLKETLMAYLNGAQAAYLATPDTRFRFIVDGEYPVSVEERTLLLHVLQDLCPSPMNQYPDGTPIIIAVGLGGPELCERCDEILPFIEAVRDLGLKVDIHSGESTSLGEHRLTLRKICPDRVAHGIAGAQDDFFFDGPIAMCPLSNVLTASWKGTLADHPITKIWNTHPGVSVNTDDPLLFSSTLTLEYAALFQAADLGREFFFKTQENALNACFHQPPFLLSENAI